MSFGYYALFSQIYRFFEFEVSQLVIFLNYVSAVSGIILIFLFGLLARQLAGISVAIFGMLILLLDHSLWNWSLYGHPSVLSVCLFLLSLYAFDKSINSSDEFPKKTTPSGYIRSGYALLSGLSALASLVIRVDILFIFFAFILISKYRREVQSKKALFIFYGSIVSIYFGLKILALGYVIAPRGGVVAGHASRLFQLKAIPAALVTNSGLFIAGIGAIFLLAALISLISWLKKQPRYILPLMLTLLPVFVLIFFKNIDFSRYSIPVHPFLAFFAALTFEKITAPSKKNIIWGVGLILFAYLLQTVLAYYPIKEIWASKFPPRSSALFVVRPVPTGLFLTDRANRHKEERRLDSHAHFLSEQKGNILVICSRLYATRMAVALLQHCLHARFCVDRTALGPQFKIFHPYASFVVVSRERDGEDILPELFNSGEYLGYSIYFLNNLQSVYPKIPIPKEYSLLSSQQ